MIDSGAQLEIDSLVARFFAAFNNCGERPTSERIAGCFCQGALITRHVGGDFELLSVSSFAAPRVTLLTDGSLTEFREHEISSSTEIFNEIASRTSQYEKSGVRNGKPFVGGGTKLFHLVKSGREWRICSLTWIEGNV